MKHNILCFGGSIRGYGGPGLGEGDRLTRRKRGGVRVLFAWVKCLIVVK